jgi:hypothetical protein
MSDARAIEAITQTLVNLVDLGVKEVEASAVAVARPLDRVADTAFAMQVNVLLFQTSIDPYLRNQAPAGLLPGESGDPGLPLSLHYLITPYVEDGDDVAAHRLLGGAVRVLHEHPALTRDELAQIAPYSNVADGVDRITITWQPLEEKDIYSLWSAFQSPYRLSAAYEVRVVTIDSRRSATTPLPVLRRGRDDTGPLAQAGVLPPFAVLTAALPPAGRPAAGLGDTVTLTGTRLAATGATVRMSHPRLADPLLVTGADLDVSATAVRFAVPDSPDSVPAGLWSLALLTTDPDGAQLVSNEVALAVAPRITSAMPLTVSFSGLTAVIALTCAPSLWPGQRVSLLLGGNAFDAQAFSGLTPTAQFPLTGAAPGRYPVRLRVDGVDSPLVDRSTTPPSFDPTQIAVVT